MRALAGFALALGAGCGTTPLHNGGGGHAGTGTGGGGQAGTGTAGGGQAGTGTGGGGQAGTGTGGGGQAGTGTGGSAAGSTGHDDCHSDGDCPQGICGPPCSELLCALGNDGFHHCTPRTPPGLSVCPTGSAMPCCQSDADCTAMPHGHCIPYSLGWCGGPAPPQGNECRYDACTSDADCTAGSNGVCTTGYPRVCIYSVCRTNPDCTAGSGGRCVLASVGGIYCPGDAVFCRYANDPCATNVDCHGGTTAFGQACVPNAGAQGTICKDVPPPPP